MINHTKGPLTYDAEHKLIYETEGLQRHIAKLGLTGVSDSEDDANGHLFVSAPAMYDEIRVLRSQSAKMRERVQWLNKAVQFGMDNGGLDPEMLIDLQRMIKAVLSESER